MSNTKFLVLWSPYEDIPHASRANFFQDLFKQDQRVIVIDLKNNKDPRSQTLLREADLVVVFLKQELACLEQYFLYDLIRNHHIIYVIDDYINDGSTDWLRQMELYRIPKEQLFLLPYSPYLQLLYCYKDIAQVIEEKTPHIPFEQKEGVLQSYRRLQSKIYESLR